MKTEPNDPAGICTTESGYVGQYTGLTKRERIAIAAMTGLLNKYQGQMTGPEGIAKAAVEQADALIEALNK